MASAQKKCRVCGEIYEACRSAKKNNGAFIWQEVACSPQCGSIYLEQIYKSRNIEHVPATAGAGIIEPVKKPIKKIDKKKESKPAESDAMAEEINESAEPVADNIAQSEDYGAWSGSGNAVGIENYT
jgi:hypothetical protein